MSCSVSQIRIIDIISSFFLFCFLFFSIKRHDPAGNVGKHNKEWLWNDLLGTPVMTVEMSVNWASDNVSSVLTNISVWKLNFKTLNGECLCLMTFYKLCWGQRCFPMTVDVSVQILPSGSCKLDNSFLHGLILSTTEVGFFIWMTNVLNVSFRNLSSVFLFPVVHTI